MVQLGHTIAEFSNFSGCWDPLMSLLYLLKKVAPGPTCDYFLQFEILGLLFYAINC